MNNQSLTPAVGNGHDRRIEAIAEVKQMHDDLIALREENGQLKADLNRERDRVAMMIEERDRYRHESARFRSLLIELSTQMSNISLLTVKAQDVVRAVHEIDAADTYDDLSAKLPEVKP